MRVMLSKQLTPEVFIYLWLCWVFVAAFKLSLVAAVEGYSLMLCRSFSLQWLLLWSTGSRAFGHRSGGTQA